MLLLLAGVESNPGPTYRMYLVHKPLVAEPRPHLHIYCQDGGLHGDFGIFYSYSRLLRQLLCDTCSCTTCKDCAGAIYLPDFSILTVAHLNELLTNGETMVEEEEEEEGKRRVLQLKLAMGCSGVSRREKIQLLDSVLPASGTLQYFTFHCYILRFAGILRGRMVCSGTLSSVRSSRALLSRREVQRSAGWFLLVRAGARGTLGT